MSFLLFPKTIFIFYFYIQTLYDKQIKNLLINFLLICLYSSPSQSRQEFESFCTNFNLFLSNINDLSRACSIITGDFDTRSIEWWKLDRKNFKGRQINIITCVAWYSQLINQQTHVTKNCSSCIGLIFTSNPNLINSSGAEKSLFEKCLYNIVYGKIDFKIPIPPPFMREVWAYKNASTESIQCSVSNIDWDFLFLGNSINKKIDILNECLKNIFHKFAPKKDNLLG